MSQNLTNFRTYFLNAYTWSERKDGIPLHLLDNLEDEDLKIAEQELINNLSLRDDWPILGLGHIKSKKSLSKLYELLSESKKEQKISIALAIFKICADSKMIDITFEEMVKVKDTYSLIHIVYLLVEFENDKINQFVANLRKHNNYLVAYNASSALKLPIAPIVEKFSKNNSKTIFEKISSLFKK